MFCLNCGSQLPDEANFCNKCASPVAIDFNYQTTHAPRVVPLGNFENQKRVVKNNGSVAAGIIMAAIFLVGLVAGGTFLLENYKEEQQKQRDREISNNNLKTDAPAPVQNPKIKLKKTVQPRAEVNLSENTIDAAPAPSQPTTIVNDTFAVNAGNYRVYKFDLDNNSRVVGRVEASGGKNDIETIVMDADEFTNFQNRGAYRAFYDSGYVTIGKIDLNLRAGSYYVVFSNSVALLTNKVVKANVEIQ